MPGSRGNNKTPKGNNAIALLFRRRQDLITKTTRPKSIFLTQEIKEVLCLSHRYKTLIKDSHYAKHVPAFIQIPAPGAIPKETTKPIHEATPDDLAFDAVSAVNCAKDRGQKPGDLTNMFFSFVEIKII